MYFVAIAIIYVFCNIVLLILSYYDNNYSGMYMIFIAFVFISMHIVIV